MKDIPDLSTFIVLFTATVIPAIVGAEFDLTFGIITSLVITLLFMYIGREKDTE